MHIMIADPDAAGRRWMGHLLAEDSQDHELVQVAERTRILEAARQDRPDVVLLSDMVADGELVSRLILDAETVVILVAVAGSGADVWQRMSGGASGYLLKDRLATELRPALTAAVSGGALVSPPLVKQMICYLNDQFTVTEPGPSAEEISDSLLPRESETLYRLADGQSTEEIASSMFIAPATVRTYVSRVLHKLDQRSRGEVIALAYRSGFYSGNGSARYAPGSDAVV